MKTVIRIGLAVLKGLIIVGALSAFSIGAYNYADNIHLFALKRVVVDGTSLISNRSIVAEAQLKFGASLLTLPMDSIQARILAHPYVAAVQISRQLPRTLFIQVKERIPIAYVHHGNFACVDGQGVILPLPRAGMTLSLPVLSGFAARDSLSINQHSSNRQLTDMVEILNTIQHVYPALYSQVSELVSTKQGYVIYSAHSPTRIYLGNSDLSNKVHILESFWTTIGNRREWDDYEYIDLRYNKQVIVRERT